MDRSLDHIRVLAGSGLDHQALRKAVLGELGRTLPFEAGVPVTAHGLDGTQIFVAQGDQDFVIPRDLLDRTWAYLHGESGAVVVSRRDAGGHTITQETLAALGDWLATLTDHAFTATSE